MRDVEDVLGDDDLRLVDVLLEERLAGTAAATPMRRVALVTPMPRRSPVWAAAAALFAVAVLLGTWWLQREPLAQAQDPTPAPRATTPFEPKDDAELQAFLKEVVMIEARSAIYFGRHEEAQSPAGVWVRITDPNQVHAMCAGWTPRGLTKENAADAMATILRLVTRDGRLLLCKAGWRAERTCYLGDRCWQVPGIDGQELMNDSQESVATSAEALRKLRPSRANLVCTALASTDLQAELPRFHDLTRLVVRLDDAMAAVVAACPSLEDLEIVIPPAAAGLSRTGWRHLASLPRLRCLTIRGDVGALEPTHLSVLQGLQELTIPGDVERKDLASVRLLLEATHLPRLVELRIALSLPHPPSAALPKDVELMDAASALTKMPTLRRLAIEAETPPLPLLTALKDSRVARLHLAGFPLDGDCVDALAAAKRLRELDLRGARFTEKGGQVMATLQQVTRLDLRGAVLSPEQLTTLQEWLPQCEVLTSPGTSTRTYPALANPSSWTEDR